MTRPIIEIRPAQGVVPGLWDALIPGTAETFFDLTQGQVQHIAAQRGLTVVSDQKSPREAGDA